MRERIGEDERERGLVKMRKRKVSKVLKDYETGREGKG